MLFDSIEDRLRLISSGELSPDDVLSELGPDELVDVTASRFTDPSAAVPIGRGLARQCGAVTGPLVLDRQVAGQLAAAGVGYVLALATGDAEDFLAIRHAVGFFTPLPAPTAWAAVQAVSEGHPTVVGVPGRIEVDPTRVGSLRVRSADGSDVLVADQPARRLVATGPGGTPVEVAEGQWVSLSGTTGALYLGELAVTAGPVGRLSELVLTVAGAGVATGRFRTYRAALENLPACPGYAERAAELAALLADPVVAGFEALKRHAIDIAPLDLAVTAHTGAGVGRAALLTGQVLVEDTGVRVRPGAVQVGLVRDERMWTSPDQLDLLRLVYLGEEALGSARFARVCQRYQTEHGARLRAVLAESHGALAVVRTPCMPYAKIFPDGFDAVSFARRHDLPEAATVARVAAMSGEQEVYQGCRGMRLLCQRPDLARLWVRTVLDAAAAVAESGEPVRLRPLLATITLPDEARMFLEVVDEVVGQLAETAPWPVPGFTLDGVSIMVETTGAYLALEEFLRARGGVTQVDGAMIGGNDFSAACLNFNREDSVRTIIPGYVERGLFPASPFETLDQVLVGPAILSALRRARQLARRDGHATLWGLGGELAGDWDTVRWLARNAEPLGLRYVTTAPGGVLTALFAAAVVEQVDWIREPAAIGGAR